MKKKLLSFALLLFIFSQLHAQNNSQVNNQHHGESVYYYYKNQKVYFNVTYKQMVIGFAEGHSFNEIRSLLGSVAQLPVDSIKPTVLKNQVQLRLKELTATERGKAIIELLKNNKQILYARPCINGMYGKLASYGNEFVVKLKPAVTMMQLRSLINQYDCKMVRAYMFDSKTFLIGAGSKNAYDGLKMANIFFESGLFEFAEPDLENYNMQDDPNDPLYYLQWDHKNTGSADQYNGVPGADMNVDSAWTITKGKLSITVAVIDEGVDTGHVELKSHLVQGFDATTLTSNIGDGRPLSGDNAHGTNCAGIIGAIANNGVGIAGIAPNCKIMPVNLADALGYYTTNSNIAAGIDFAWNNGADVLSDSWGGGSPSSVLDDAIHRAVTQGRNGKGCIVFFSSGNNNAGMSYPALNREVVAVGGINMCNQRKDPNSCDGEYWWGASYGEGLSVVAPCVKIPSTDISGSAGYSSNDYYTIFNGTSAACPHAAAVAALILSVKGSYTQDQVRTIIENTADKIPGYDFKLTPGYKNGTWNNELGYGRVDAYHAVLAAQSGNFCNVQIAANGATRFCDGDSVKLKVVNPTANVSYKWYKNGVATSNSKTAITVKQSCEYYISATYNNGCVAYSSPITITEVKSAGTLIADAGKDVSLCTGVTGVRIGGMVPAKGGMPYLNEKRAYAMDWYTNNFYRFSLSSPSSLDTIATNMLSTSDRNNGYFFSGGDFTPYGYYAVIRLKNNLVRIDTLNGSQQIINTITPTSGEWVGLAWDPQGQQLYAASSFGTQTQIYTVDLITGNVQFVATVPIYYVIWIAFNNEGQMYALCNNDRRIYKINKTTGAATGLPSVADDHLGYAQDADFDPVTDSLYLTAFTARQNNVGDLRIANTQTGTVSSVGVVGNTNYNEMDATAIAGNTYKCTWKPAAGLSNIHDPNPWASPSKNTNYTLTVKDMCGNQATSKVKVTINANPPFVKITAPKDTICSGQKVRLSATAKVNYYYQWYLNGNPIANATDSFYVAKRAGTYKVHVFAGTGGCDKMSKPFKLNKCAVAISGFAGNDAAVAKAENERFALFPNPATNLFTVTLPVSNKVSVISVYDIDGKIVLRKALKTTNAAEQINISQLAAGAYRVTWQQDDQQYMWKLIKQ